MTAQLNMDRLTFPKHKASQFKANVPNRFTALGPISTDLARTGLGKAITRRLVDISPDLDKLFVRMTMTDTDINAVLRKAPASNPKKPNPPPNPQPNPSGKMPDIREGRATTDALLFDAACYWLKNHTATWKASTPPRYLDMRPNSGWEAWMPLTWNCPAGRVYVHRNNSCEECVNNTIAATPGLSACVPCLDGYKAPASR